MKNIRIIIACLAVVFLGIAVYWLFDKSSQKRPKPNPYETACQAHDEKNRRFREHYGLDITELLDIHHPLLNDLCQQNYIYKLSEEECRKTERILRDLITHSHELVVIEHTWYSEGGPKTTFRSTPDKKWKEKLAQTFAVTDWADIMPPYVTMDPPDYTIALVPYGVNFRFYSSELSIGMRRSPHSLDGRFSDEFVEACQSLRSAAKRFPLME